MHERYRTDGLEPVVDPHRHGIRRRQRVADHPLVDRHLDIGEARCWRAQADPFLLRSVMSYIYAQILARTQSEHFRVVTPNGREHQHVWGACRTGDFDRCFIRSD